VNDERRRRAADADARDPGPPEPGAPVPPPTAEHLRVVAQRVPPPSKANDDLVVAASALAALGGVVFGVGLLLGAPLSVYGTALAIALLALGVGVRRFVADRFADVEALEPRPLPEDDDSRVADVQALPRRGFLGRLLAAAAGVVGLGLVAPVVSLGPMPGDALRRTDWAPGKRLVTTAGRPVRPGDLAPGSVLTVWPEDAIEVEFSSAVVLRLAAGEPEPPTNRDWVVDGNVLAYSKVCTHAGCPVALFRERDDALFCPCHQSTFDVRRGAEPTFGPAARALPQLPLGVDADGFLVATGDFVDQVGPAFG
jgi:ubiquinol-cytochrome c reductase iron-sulfur subunit